MLLLTALCLLSCPQASLARDESTDVDTAAEISNVTAQNETAQNSEPDRSPAVLPADDPETMSRGYMYFDGTVDPPQESGTDQPAGDSR